MERQSTRIPAALYSEISKPRGRFRYWGNWRWKVGTHLEISRNPSSYPRFAVSIRSDPVGVVVTPTTGLANSIVRLLNFLTYGLEDFGIIAFAYTSENIAAKRRAGIHLVKKNHFMPVPHYLCRSRTSTRTGMDSHRQLFAHPPEPSLHVLTKAM